MTKINKEEAIELIRQDLSDLLGLDGASFQMEPVPTFHFKFDMALRMDVVSRLSAIKALYEFDGFDIGLKPGTCDFFIKDV